MKRFIIVLLLSISCTSSQDYYFPKPKISCASDNNNNIVICDLKLELNTSNWWLNQNNIVIEQYEYKFNNIKKTEHRLILTIAVMDFYHYDSVRFNIDDKPYILKPGKQKQDETSGLQQILYFSINRNFIKTLAGAQNVSIETTGRIYGTYSIKNEDIPVILEFYNSVVK